MATRLNVLRLGLEFVCKHLSAVERKLRGDSEPGQQPPQRG